MNDVGFAGGNERNRRYCQILHFAYPKAVACGYADPFFPHFFEALRPRRLATVGRVSNNLRRVRNARRAGGGVRNAPD